MQNRLTTEPIDISKLESQLDDPACGGVVIFVGKVRNHHEGKAVQALSYEAYAPMVEKTFRQIGEEAVARFGVKSVNIVHRVGNLTIGDVAVWVGVQSAHRAEAFDACRYAINQLKERAPIWKREHYVDGLSQWVQCHHSDERMNNE